MTDLGQAVARAMGHRLAAHEERSFEDGEHKARPLEEVSGADVFVIESLHGGPIESVNDKLCRLLFFIGTLKDAGADRITAVVPYLCYARKDRRTKPRDPVTTRYIAQMFEAVGCDRIVTLDVHNPVAFENAFHRRTIALTAAPLFVDYARGLKDECFCVVSPDPGGAKRAELFRETLEQACGRPVGKGFADKHRSAGIVSGNLFVGDVAGATALVVDDLISTGNTLVRAATAARQAGARRVLALQATRTRKPRKLILAVPVAPMATIEELRGEVDEIVCLEPHEFFGAIGLYYSDFHQVGDDEVIELLARHPARPSDRLRDSAGYA